MFAGEELGAVEWYKLRMISSPQPQRRVIHTLASLGSIPEQHYDRQPPTQPQQQQQRRKRSRVSEDTLVSNGPGFSRVDSNETLVEQRKDMANADEVTAAAIERVRSYGIGGAGNMRMASAVKAAQDAPPAAKQEGKRVLCPL